MTISFNGEQATQMLRSFGGSARSRAKKSGIDCPECESEMFFPEPNVIHHEPLRKRVRCSKCEYKGFVGVEL